MSGLTLCTNASAFPHKITYIDQPLCPSPSVIASLTISKLYHNPHYCKLRKQYDYISRVLAKSMDSGITRTTMSGFPTPNLDHCAYYYLVSRFGHTNETLALHADPNASSCVAFPSANSRARSTLGHHSADSCEVLSLGPSNVDSHTSSSLGPSDSASQNAASDADNAAIERLLKLEEVLSLQPSCIKPSVLWYYTDCLTDMVCAYFRAGCPPTHGCCGMECARRFLSIVSNSINPYGTSESLIVLVY
jgi:hypothetical protein